MAASLPGSSTRVLLDTDYSHTAFCKLIRTFKRAVCIVLGGSNVYLHNAENDNRILDPIEWEVLKPNCHDKIVDLFFDRNKIIYLCEHGCIHRYDAKTKSTLILQSSLNENQILSIDPFPNGFCTTISSGHTSKEWILNIHSLNKHFILTFTRTKLSNTLTRDEMNMNDVEKMSTKNQMNSKPVVICLHAASLSAGDYYHNSVSIETTFFEELFCKSQGLSHLKSQSLLVGFPDGQVCSFLHRSSESGIPLAVNNSNNLICCLHSPIVGIFLLNLKSGLLFDCICIVGQNGKVIILRLSEERQNHFSLIEFYIPKPVFSCDINQSTLVHCDGNHIYSTELKICKGVQDTIHSDVCSELIGVTGLKVIYKLSDNVVMTVISVKDGRIMEAILDLKNKFEFKSSVSEMKSVFSKIQTCSEKLLEMKLLEEKQRNLLSSLSIASTLILSGNAADYFECRCSVHSCTIAYCTLVLSIKNNSPYALNYSAWCCSCIIKWPLNNLTQEKENQIIKSQPLATDLKRGDIFTSHIIIPLNTLTNSWQFPLKLIPFFVLIDSRFVPVKPLAMLPLRDVILTELSLLQPSSRMILMQEKTLQEKIWKMAEQNKNFREIFQKFPPDSRVSLSTEILCTSFVSCNQLLPAHVLENSNVNNIELFWRGFKIGFVEIKDGISTTVLVKCDHLGLLAKLRSGVIRKLKEVKQGINGEVECIALPQSAIRSHLEVTSLMNNFYLMNTTEQLQCLMHLYYELRNQISSKLPLIINKIT